MPLWLVDADDESDLGGMLGTLICAAAPAQSHEGLPEPEVALRSRMRHVPRLAAAPHALAGAVRLHMHSRGAISNLHILPQSPLSSSD